MTSRIASRSLRALAPLARLLFRQNCARQMNTRHVLSRPSRITPLLRTSFFHTTTFRYAQSPSADALMESLTDLYATAKDEFEIAYEETEKNTTYAEDDRQAAREALENLKIAFEKAVRESDPEVAKEVTSRVGQRIRELESAVKAMEDSAIEH